MILLFVDETSDNKFKDYFGICCAAVKHNFYVPIKTEFQKILLDGGWDPTIEFKGSYLFSASKGCTDIPVEKRVEMAESVISLNTAKKNARMKFAYFSKSSDNPRQDYLDLLPALVDRILKQYPHEKGQGKDLVSLHCDRRTDVSAREIQKLVLPVIESRGYTLFEEVIQVDSNFDTVGVLYADIVGYLAGRIDTISNDSQLFESIPPHLFSENGKVKKLRSSIRIIDNIKNLTIYTL